MNSSAYKIGVLCYHVVVSLYTETQRQARDKLRKTRGQPSQNDPSSERVRDPSYLVARDNVRDGLERPNSNADLAPEHEDEQGQLCGLPSQGGLNRKVVAPPRCARLWQGAALPCEAVVDASLVRQAPLELEPVLPRLLL